MKRDGGSLWILKASDSINIYEKEQRFAVSTGRGRQAESICVHTKEWRLSTRYESPESASLRYEEGGGAVSVSIRS